MTVASAKVIVMKTAVTWTTEIVEFELLATTAHCEQG